MCQSLLLKPCSSQQVQVNAAHPVSDDSTGPAKATSPAQRNSDSEFTATTMRGPTRKVSNIKWRYQECFGAVAQPFELMPTRSRISVDADETESRFLLRSAAVNPPHWRKTIGFSALTRAAEWDDLGAFQGPIEEMGITLRLGIVSNNHSV